MRLEIFLLPLADPVQVDLVADSHGHHDPDHCTQHRAEDPHCIRGFTHHGVGGSVCARTQRRLSCGVVSVRRAGREALQSRLYSQLVAVFLSMVDRFSMVHDTLVLLEMLTVR